jgi:CheY-like chemotaxis protein
MRLNFNVLWVDDQPERVESLVKRIARQMEEEGFHFNPTTCKSIAAVGERIMDHVFNDEVDLILVDWDLGGGVHGEDAIATIRDAVPYKDIVFYSAQNSTDELRKAIAQKGIEGVFFASRGELVDEVIGVFESLVKKVLDLDHTRGIVMGATSDIDQMLTGCLVAIHDKLDEADQKEMIEEALRYIEKKLAEWTKEAAKLRKKGTIAAMLKANAIFSANDRLRVLIGALKQEKFKNHAPSVELLVTYMEEVVPRRNHLGHLVLAPEGRPRAIADIETEGKEVSLDEMRDLRKRILGLRQDFKALLSALQVRNKAISSAQESSNTE